MRRAHNTMPPTQRKPPPGPMHRLLAGAGVGWVVLPLVVFAHEAARAYAGAESIASVVADALLGAIAGLVIGVSGLGGAGFVGAVGGGVAGLVVPYIVIPALLGLHAPDVEVYGRYLAAGAATIVATALGTAAATKSGTRMSVRPVIPFVAGLIVIGLWFAFWLFWAAALSPRTVELNRPALSAKIR